MKATVNIHHVYVYTNVLTGAKYVGRTKDLRKRHRDHMSHARRGRKFPFHCAVRQYGEENFTKEVVYTGGPKMAQRKEMQAIADLRKKGVELYNKTDGGTDIGVASHLGRISQMQQHLQWVYGYQR